MAGALDEGDKVKQTTSSRSVLEPWLAPVLAGLPGLAIIDAHTHIGADVDGTVLDAEGLLSALDDLEARAVTFPLAVVGGYAPENDAVIAAAAASGERLVPFCRLDPHDSPLAEGARATAAGARGIKLHPRAENFTLAHPGVEDAFSLADDHGLPVLIHAGRGIEPLGRDALRLAAEHPRANVILAHTAITDLAWLGEEISEHPNVFFDTSWWNPADMLALFATIPPGRILYASDTPYGDPALHAVLTLRAAMACGLGDEQLRSVMGLQVERILAGEPAVDLGPAPGSGAIARDILLDRALAFLLVAVGMALAGSEENEALGLARMALNVSGDHPHRDVCDSALEALDLPEMGPRGLGSLMIALAVVATPGVPVGA